MKNLMKKVFTEETLQYIFATCAVVMMISFTLILLKLAIEYVLS